MFSRPTKIIIAFVAIVLGGYFVAQLGFTSSTPPADFRDARMQGALIAQDIVNLSNGIGVDLQKVNQLENQHDYAGAVSLTTELFQKSQEVRQREVDLSNELEKMTRALSDIKSTDARQAALDSIASRMTLINRLINYNNDLANLLNALNARFAGARNGAEIATLINQINAEVTAINSFNEQAGQAMDRFDAIVNK